MTIADPLISINILMDELTLVHNVLADTHLVVITCSM